MVLPLKEKIVAIDWKCVCGAWKNMSGYLTNKLIEQYNKPYTCSHCGKVCQPVLIKE